VAYFFGPPLSIAPQLSTSGDIEDFVALKIMSVISEDSSADVRLSILCVA